MADTEAKPKARFKLPTAVPRSKIEWLADQFIRHNVYTWLDMRPDEVAMVFLPLFFGVLKGATKAQITKIMVFGVYGENHTTGVAINGWPTFTSCNIWRREDVVAAAQLAEAMEAAIVEAKAAGRGEEPS